MTSRAITIDLGAGGTVTGEVRHNDADGSGVVLIPCDSGDVLCLYYTDNEHGPEVDASGLGEDDAMFAGIVEDALREAAFDEAMAEHAWMRDAVRADRSAGGPGPHATDYDRATFARVCGG